MLRLRCLPPAIHLRLCIFPPQAPNSVPFPCLALLLAPVAMHLACSHPPPFPNVGGLDDGGTKNAHWRPHCCRYLSCFRSWFDFVFDPGFGSSVHLPVPQASTLGGCSRLTLINTVSPLLMCEFNLRLFPLGGIHQR